MILRPCSHEKDVAEMLALGHYPEACTPELRAHLSGCRSCAELVLVTRSFQAARANLAANANLGSPGLIWWRAQLRRRDAAVERVNKPIVRAQVFALTVSVLFAVGFLATQATHGLRWLSWVEQFSPMTGFHLDTWLPSGLSNSGLSLLVLLPIFATFFLLSGVAVYLASEKQ